ncbi:hypothetical protein DFP96_10161 [Listeria rocourtiae]|uniref:Uncharacterized protein n=1 Tax=Listeria rocourtiae TaxID=647910 RepID=A0A4R6ZR46_9LIST|nr:hypothetical protein PROCOU_13818 [Listeria rocourtiae FSL F6-920]TDR55133.1 hypothetical protein DFP96_10161 [Listeria rocourtiae]
MKYDDVEKDPCCNKGLKNASLMKPTQPNCNVTTTDSQVQPIKFSAEGIDSLIHIATLQRDNPAILALIESHGVSAENTPYVIAFLSGWFAAQHGAP